MMILHRTNETPKVAGDKSDRDNEGTEYMKREKEKIGGKVRLREQKEERIDLTLNWGVLQYTTFRPKLLYLLVYYRLLANTANCHIWSSAMKAVTARSQIFISQTRPGPRI